jgi:hypothetical protein
LLTLLLSAVHQKLVEQVYRRTTGQDLAAAIGRFISAWNQRCQPFTWTKDANTILGKLNRTRTAATVRSDSASLSP